MVNQRKLVANDRFKLIPAVYLILRKDNSVLLLRRTNTGYQDGRYGLIAGHLEGDEVATESMIREAKEEVGITVKKTDLRFVHLAHRLTRNDPGQERLDIFFESRKWDGIPKNTEPSKCDDLSWFPIDGLPDKTIPLVSLVISDVIEGIYYSEYEIEPI